MSIKTRAQLPILTDPDGINLKLSDQVPVVHLRVYDTSTHSTDMQLMEVYSTKLGGAILPIPENFFYKQIIPETYKPRKLDEELKLLLKQRLRDKSLTVSLQPEELKQIEKLTTKPIEGKYPYCTFGVGVGSDTPGIGLASDNTYGVFTTSLMEGNDRPYKIDFKNRFRDTEQLKEKFSLKQQTNMESTTHALTSLLKEIYKACIKYEEALLNQEFINDQTAYRIMRASGINPEPGTRVLSAEGELNGWFTRGLVVRHRNELMKDYTYKAVCWLSEVNLEKLRKKSETSKFSFASLIRGWNQREAKIILRRWEGVDAELISSFRSMFDSMDKQLNIDHSRSGDYALSIIDLMGNENSLVVEI